MNAGLQLEMNFDHGINRFQNCLDNGVFSLLVETGAPALDTELEHAAERLKNLEAAASAVSVLPTSLAITDKYLYYDCWNICDFISALPSERRDRHVVYLSGFGTSPDQLLETANICVAKGFRNLVPVSGNIRPGDQEADVRGRDYTESVTLLKLLRNQNNARIFSGTAVNPFKYTKDACFGNYYKLIKKLNMGAGFMVTHLGWDLAKLQELRWYLSARGMYYPAIARLWMLTQDKMEKILRGEMPGVVLPGSLRKILEAEFRYSSTQFEAAQWRRLQLYAAGCKLLGFSGIQVAGIDTPEKLNIAVQRIAAGLHEFDTFYQWRAAYREHLGQIDLSPYPYSFYVFEKLLSNQHPQGEFPQMRVAKTPVPGIGEKIGDFLRRFMFFQANNQAPNERYILKKLMAGCHACSACRLPQTMYICPEKCPKGLANGPCGGTRPGGGCELSTVRECVHLRIARHAILRNEADMLEDDFVFQSTLRNKKNGVE